MSIKSCKDVYELFNGYMKDTKRIQKKLQGYIQKVAENYICNPLNSNGYNPIKCCILPQKAYFKLHETPQYALRAHAKKLQPYYGKL